MRKILIIIIFVSGFRSLAQDSTREKNSSVSFIGYAELYYGYDFNRPFDNNRPAFVYSYNRHNEITVNLAFLKAAYSSEGIRGNIAIAAGTYMNANYAAEPGVLKNIFEANVGKKLSKHGNLWIDAGIMPSHIGFESAIGKDCWALTRSILADNSPYYESGVKITYVSGNGKWLLSGLALNGWQRIQRVAGNSLISWGTQVSFKPSSKLTLNYSTFLGTDKPDSARLWRYFHNTYCIFQLSEVIGLTLGFDLGQEQVSKGSNELNTWFSPVALLRITPDNNWAVAMRGEYYDDKKSVIVATGSPNGFRTFGASVNIDRSIGSHFLWRTEVKTFINRDEIFVSPNGTTNTNTVITMLFVLSF